MKQMIEPKKRLDVLNKFKKWVPDYLIPVAPEKITATRKILTEQVEDKVTFEKFENDDDPDDPIIHYSDCYVISENGRRDENLRICPCMDLHVTWNFIVDVIVFTCETMKIPFNQIVKLE